MPCHALHPRFQDQSTTNSFLRHSTAPGRSCGVTRSRGAKPCPWSAPQNLLSLVVYSCWPRILPWYTLITWRYSPNSEHVLLKWYPPVAEPKGLLIRGGHYFYLFARNGSIWRFLNGGSPTLISFPHSTGTILIASGVLQIMYICSNQFKKWFAACYINIIVLPG